jgi:hypothetical protein
LQGPYTVTVDGVPARISAGTNNETHVFLYFTFNHSTKIVKVIGTEAIPEFPPSTILPLFLLLVLLTLSALKMRKKNDLLKVKT